MERLTDEPAPLPVLGGTALNWLLAIFPGPSFFRRNTNLPRPGGHKGVGRHAAHQKDVCSNRRPGSNHRFPAKNGGIRVDSHPVFDVRMAFTTFLNFPFLVLLKAAGA